MSPAPHLLHVNSRPTQVPPHTWRKWYMDEHLPDLVQSGTSARATLYEEIELPGSRGTGNPRTFLALYQTGFAEPLLSSNYTGLRTTSELFEEAGADSEQIAPNGDFDARNYNLVQVYDLRGIGEVPSPQIITAEMHPLDPDDCDRWYREEHLDMLAKLPGYRRTLRYRLGPRTALTKGEDPPVFLAIHEVEDAVKALSTKEIEAANATEWTKKNVKESNPFIARGWRLVHSEGY